MANPNISATASGSINASETAEIWLPLLTISHESLPNTFRLVRNSVDITSNGNVYTATGMEINPPSQAPDEQPFLTASFEDIDQVVVSGMRTIEVQTTDRPVGSFSVVLASALDVVVLGPFDFEITDAEFDAGGMKLRLGFQNILRETFPGTRFVPSIYPALF